MTTTSDQLFGYGDSTASIINAFTTFLLLSFSKILFVSFTLLHNFSFKDNTPNKCVLYYDSTVECHSQEYTIFSAIAYVLVIFIICPTILLILFRKCALHMFMESFQGQYKDGTNGAHDFRMVSASFLILILRMLILFLFLNHHRLPAHIKTTKCPFCMCHLFVCHYKTIQVKLHEECFCLRY